ncbi:MAG TPA: hypothetical protein VF669_04850 [Tepidisphaeraceae bacterium]
MKRMAVVLVLVVGGIIAFGFHRGWFRAASENAGGQSDVTLSVDRDKMQDDKNKAVDKVQDLGHRARNTAAATTQKTTN